MNLQTASPCRHVVLFYINNKGFIQSDHLCKFLGHFLLCKKKGKRQIHTHTRAHTFGVTATELKIREIIISVKNHFIY